LVDDYDQDMMTILSINPNDAVDDGDKIIWNVENLPGNTTWIYNIEVLVKNNLIVGKYESFNYATINPVGYPSSQDEVVTSFSAIPNLKVDKKISDNDEFFVKENTIEANSNDFERAINYQVEVENIGTAVLTNVFVVDDYDQSGLTIVENNGGFDDGDKIIWNIPLLNPGQKLTYTITVRLNNNLEGGKVVKNFAIASSNEIIMPVSDVVQTIIISPIGNIIGIGEDQQVCNDLSSQYLKLSPNELINYTFTIKNDGNGKLSNATVVNDYDENFVDIISFYPLNAVDDGDKIIWNLDEISPNNEVKYKVYARVKNTAPIEQQFLNTLKLLTVGHPEKTSTIFAKVVASPNFSDTTKSDFGVKVVKTVSDACIYDNQDAHTNTVRPSESYTYTVKVINNTASNQTNVLVKDDYDQDKIEIISIPASAVDDGDTISWNVENLLAGQSLQFEIVVKVKNTLSSGLNTILNNVLIIPIGFPQDNDFTTTFVEGTPSLLLTKKVSDSDENDKKNNTILGDSSDLERTQIYTITAKNNGTTDLNNLTITDDYLEQYLSILDTNGGFDDGNKIVWTVPLLKSNDEISFYLKVIIKPNLIDFLIISNTANASSDEIVSQSQDTVYTTIYSPNLKLVKTVTDAYTCDNISNHNNLVKPEDFITYTISLTNDGHGQAFNSIITDDYDQTQMDIISISPNTGVVNDGDKITWNLGLFNSGETLNYTIVAKIKNNFEFGIFKAYNTAFIESNYQKAEDETITNIASVARMAVSKLVSDNNQTLVSTNRIQGDGTDFERVQTYTISVANTGTAILNNLVIIDDYDETKMTVIDTYGGLNSAGKITWLLNSLQPKEIVNFNLTVRLNTGLSNNLSVNNTVSVTSDERPHSQNTSSNTILNSPVLSIIKTLNDNNENGVKTNTASPGDIITYNLRIRNSGNGYLSSTLVVDDYDETKIEIISVDYGGVDDGDKITWNLEKIEANSSQYLTVQAKIKTNFTEGTYFITNSAQTTSTNYIGGTSSATTNVLATTNLSFSKTVSDENEENVKTNNIQGYDTNDLKRTIKYKLSVVNTGTAAVTGVSVLDDYDQNNLTILDTQNGSDNGDTISWNIPILEVGQFLDFYITAIVNEGLADNFNLNNVAILDTDQTAPNTQSATTIIHSPNLVFEKKVDNKNPVPSSLVKYTLVAKNIGSGDAYQILIDDILPLELQVVENSISNNGFYDSTRRTISWFDSENMILDGTFSSLNNEIVVSFEAKISDILPIGNNIIDNQAFLNTHLLPQLNDNEEIIVNALPKNEIKKYVQNLTSIGDGRLNNGQTFDGKGEDANTILNNSRDVRSIPGDTLIYHIEYKNDGSSESPETYLIDTLPRYLQDKNGDFIEVIKHEDLAASLTIPDSLFWSDGKNWIIQIYLGTLDPGQKGYVDLIVKINSDLGDLLSENENELILDNNVKIYSNDFFAGSQIAEVSDNAIIKIEKIPTTISGSIFLDSNKNGIKDSGEVYISGMKVEVDSGSGAQTLLTDEFGEFKLQVEPNVELVVYIEPENLFISETNTYYIISSPTEDGYIIETIRPTNSAKNTINELGIYPVYYNNDEVILANTGGNENGIKIFYVFSIFSLCFIYYFYIKKATRIKKN